MNYPTIKKEKSLLFICFYAYLPKYIETKVKNSNELNTHIKNKKKKERERN